MFRSIVVGVATVAAAGMTLAQEPAPKSFFFQRFGAEAPPPEGGNVTFVSAEMAFEGKTVTGAPYAAEAVTESTQTLADGNRISQTTKGLVARDSEGRTRREQTIGIGLPAAQGESMKLVFINDPVAQWSYVLHPDHTAERLPLTRGPVTLSVHGPGFTGTLTGPGTPTVKSTATVSISKPTVEPLGLQTIEGVQAEGKRTTSVIPAGAIGNEQDIRIVNETWYSNDLQTVVSSTNTDPRMGTITFRLTNIQRAEPSPDLFQVPSGYTVREMPKPDTQVDYKPAK